MSAEVLRTKARARLEECADHELGGILANANADYGHLKDRLGFIRGVRLAIHILNEEYAELNK